jgi:hypothetical protein
MKTTVKEIKDVENEIPNCAWCLHYLEFAKKYDCPKVLVDKEGHIVGVIPK